MRADEVPLEPAGTSCCVCVWPQIWPPLGFHHFFDGVTGNGRFFLKGFPTGQLALVVEDAKGNTKLHLTQAVQATRPGRVVLAFSWSDGSATLVLNSHQLTIDPEAQEPVLFFTPEPIPVRVPVVHPEDLDLARDPDERFFLETLLDLEGRLVEATRYDIVRAAGLLRQLILEGRGSLAKRVASSRRMKLRFRVIGEPSDRPPPLGPPLYLWETWGGFGVEKLLKRTVGLDTFLSLPILTKGATCAKVGDVIKVCANSLGGVHRGTPTKTEEVLLVEFDSPMTPSAPLHALRDITTIVLDAMRPIVNAITGKGALPGP